MPLAEGGERNIEVSAELRYFAAIDTLDSLHM